MPYFARVIRDYTTHFANPIAGKAGDRLLLGRHDDEYPGWVWCTGPDGREGWVPEAYLDAQDQQSGILRRDYDARELSVQAGETLEVEFGQNGWSYVRRVDGEYGWVPESVLLSK